jgi:predicted amidohydrolase YtcJ
MDIVLRNATVYTSDEQQPWADTIAVRDGRFVFVGQEADWSGGDSFTVHDMGGRLVLPGLIDSHTHPSLVAASQWHVRLPWTHDVDELLEFIRAYGEAHPPEEMPFIYFEYYPSSLFGEGHPTNGLLDSAISDRPVLCQDFSEHSHWVNSQMLELMGITAATPDPVPGLEMFERDELGEPIGHLRENVHLRFIETMYAELGWRPPTALTAESMRPFFQFMTEHGVTALFEALVDDEDTLRSVAELDAAGELNLHYEGAPRFRTLDDLPESIATVRRYQATYGSDRIRIRTLKLFLDGTNESGNSALLEPHSNDRCGDTHGETQMDVDELTECLVQCNRSDVDMHIHMVGDRAFRIGCDAVQAARARTAGAGEEWRIQVTFAHCELVDPADMSRPADLGIIVNWTAHWSGGYFGEEAKKYLGDERWNRMYAFNDIAASGATLTFSSDVVTHYELNRANPFFGMQVAHERVDPQYPLDSSRHPRSVRPSDASRLSLERLVKGYTIDGARQLRIDDLAGSIELGKVANLMVLDQDLFSIAADSIRELRPAAVLFEGSVVSGSL